MGGEVRGINRTTAWLCCAASGCAVLLGEGGCAVLPWGRFFFIEYSAPGICDRKTLASRRRQPASGKSDPRVACGRRCSRPVADGCSCSATAEYMLHGPSDDAQSSPAHVSQFFSCNGVRSKTSA